MSDNPLTTLASRGEDQQSATYEAGCHCGYVKFAVTLAPPLPEHQVVQCNCSACVRFGYLLVYPEAKDVVWHNNGRARCANYQFNTKQLDQMFCPKCGASLGIDLRERMTPHRYAISARAFYGLDLDELTYKKVDGREKAVPAGDHSGHCWDEEKQEMK
ncbi:Uu.00g072700.m01.CDS01 [Anthostomella pinea]|uniref:Uu.00g072700.m01.CDS01 n=1 Tax=Anthostomella pinea TaxID=933095 RepID=A0AAI8YNX5_9PEZI|nr:Uu.00g072700.m01.CDS01 [Anthostomella pinea]